jgi:glycosyltransferase involved in cell wall biosynthesis
VSRIVRVSPTASAAELRRALVEPDGHVAVVADHVGDDELAVLVGVFGEAGIASASPLPLTESSRQLYPLHAMLPPAPTLALPCRTSTVFNREALFGLGDPRPDATTTEELLIAVAERLLQRGWRHVAAPGLAMDWDPADSAAIDPTAAWSRSVVAQMVGPANVGLETHQAWAASRIGRLEVVVDGACITDDPHTGTQHLVVQVARELALTRPSADVVLAVPAGSIPAARAAVEGTAVNVRDRSRIARADVLYRPYQMLFASELEFVTSVGRRRLVGQLDMIGFSNPFYHPSPELFWIARNLQRHLMRTADGVTFISDYGRRSSLAECPDLEPSRLHVVSCGADPAPNPAASTPLTDETPYVLCLSATFWHKNRAHAISTFAELAERGYEGGLVIAGPEPFYGRSLDADRELLRRLGADVAGKVRFLGQVSDADKWWLLAHADAVLYPSVVEGFGLVPFEAAAVDTPCLAYAGTAPGQILSSTDAIIETWDPSAWAERVRGWIVDESDRADVVAQIRRVAESYSWRRCAELTWDAIDATLAQPRRSGETDEGGRLSRVADVSSVGQRSATMRFTLARAIPAVRRRVVSLAARAERHKP